MTLLIRHITIVFSTALLLVSLSACNGSKALTKKGNKLNEAGMYTEAANMFYVALRKKSTNVDAKIGMKSTGQYVLNNYLDKFASARGMGQKKDAVYRFLEAEDYYKKIKGVGVELNFADFYRQDYLQVRNDYLQSLYEEGSSLMEEAKFDQAHSVFDEISKLDPDFKDAGELKDIAYLEPLYAKGVQSLENQRHREALNYFEDVIAKDPNYKEVNQKIAEALDGGQFSVAVMPFVNATSEAGLDAKLSAYALEALSSVNDPFLKVVDRDNLQQILDEQRLGLSGVIDENTAVTVGELMGAEAIVTGTVLNYQISRGKISSYDREGFESYKVKKYNAEQDKYFYETKYKKTSYKEYYGENKAVLSFQFKMISLATGEVILTKIIEKEEKDQVNYAIYEGDQSNLFPAQNGGINLNRVARNQLVNKLNSRRELRSPDDLSNAVYKSVGAGMTHEIENVLKEVIK